MNIMATRECVGEQHGVSRESPHSAGATGTWVGAAERDTLIGDGTYARCGDLASSRVLFGTIDDIPV